MTTLKTWCRWATGLHMPHKLCQPLGQGFCDTYNVRLRACSMLLSHVEESRSSFLKKHGDLPPDAGALFEVNITLDEGDRAQRAALNFLNIQSPLDVRLLLYVMHGRDVMDGNGLLTFPPEVKRVVIDVGAHHCTWRGRRTVR